MDNYFGFYTEVFMSIFAISDLHLSFGTDKPMDVFGEKWDNYTYRIKENWTKKVNMDDVVIIPGDISWAMYIDEAVEDFKFINSLPGTKLILKGNHDYWWTTHAKMEKFLRENGFDTIKILGNEAYLYEGVAICGTRGWSLINENSSEEDKKIFSREKIRMVLSLEDARKKLDKILFAMHYPPVEKENPNREFLEILKEYGVKDCIYGHLHAHSQANAVTGEVNGINLKLISCDYINFDPVSLQIL